MHQYPKNWVTIGHAVVHNAWAVPVFSAGIKCPYCISLESWPHQFMRNFYWKKAVYSFIYPNIQKRMK